MLSRLTIFPDVSLIKPEDSFNPETLYPQDPQQVLTLLLSDQPHTSCGRLSAVLTWESHSTHDLTEVDHP